MVSKSLEERNELEAYIPIATKRIRICQLYWILSIGCHDRTLFIAKKDKFVDIVRAKANTKQLFWVRVIKDLVHNILHLQAPHT